MELFIGAFANMHKVTITFKLYVCVSLRPHKRNSASTKGILISLNV
jgi:hypothetical protein